MNTFTLPNPTFRRSSNRSVYVDYPAGDGRRSDGTPYQRIVRIHIAHDKNVQRYYADGRRVEVADRMERTAFAFRNGAPTLAFNLPRAGRLSQRQLDAYVDDVISTLQKLADDGDPRVAAIFTEDDPTRWSY